MVKKKEEEAEEEEEREQEQEHHRVDPKLISYIFEPSDDRLPELTDMPLNQVNPMTWMAVFEEATRDLEDRMDFVKAEKMGIAKGVYKPKMLSEVWRRWYYKHRRSLEGFGIMRAAQLANKQLETQSMEPEASDIIDYRR